MPDSQTSTPTPISDIRVLDFSAALSGPYATRILAELGATVIKVEPVGGEQARSWAPFWEGDGCYFLDMNNNKRSLCVDLKSPSARVLLERLVARSDVLVENFRPGVMKRLGLDYEATRAIRDDLIYCSISAFGQTGPRTTEAGYDPTIQALAGIMRSTGEPDGPPQRIGLSVVDRGTSLWSVIAILAALHHRSSSGEGQHIDTSLLDTAVSWMSYDILSYLATGTAPVRVGLSDKGSAPSGVFQAGDGSLQVSAPSQALWLRLCEGVGHPELSTDTRFADMTSRVRNVTALVAELESIFRTAPRAAWVGRLTRAGVPCAPVNTVPETLRDPQVVARRIVTSEPGADSSRSFVTSPMRFSRATLQEYMSAPALGADTDAILAEDLGFSPEDIREMRSAGVIA